MLFGREQELDALAELLDGARAGRGALVWLLGEGGIGKTALAGAVGDVARERGMAVLRAEADELERHRPFGSTASTRATAPSTAPRSTST
ncbi:ATP-binding protein [Conexibacter sp. CPCC 205762]|uniref:ATP-binding protein n=1 Tax=Conexibacter sp. CPCC 205762 TaxID=3064573 RepID=UPI00271FA02D|nr:ATP-binding protein [Conexibacter sp. CPCC 205762]MDO8200703.1 ATP-binding protein [Conexibacter sp. CPCC 205762]